jgi:glycerophosphoryl diester phosphodiesterase
MPAPWVIAHRGASACAPENTMAAFRRAVELGAQFIETDLHLSRDGHIVAIHDDTLGRTCNGSGLVIEHTLEELRQLDAGSWFSPEFAGQTIPTLEEILELSGQADLSLYLEIKGGSGYGIERALAAALHERREAHGVVVLSFEARALEVVHQLDRVLMTGLLFEDSKVDSIERAVKIGARQLAPRGDRVTPELVARAHAHGLQVVTWTINEPEHMRALIAAGVEGIMTDYPDRLATVIGELPSGAA